MQRAAIEAEGADGQPGLDPGQRSREGRGVGLIPQETWASGSGGGGAAATVREVRHQVVRLVAKISGRSGIGSSNDNRNDNTNNDDKSKGSNDVVNNEGDDGDVYDDGVGVPEAQGLGVYLGCSDQALIEYADSTVLPLLDATLRR